MSLLVRSAALVFGWVVVAQAQQQSALLSNADFLKISDRAGQLVESTAIAIPDLLRSSAPLREALQQARANLRSRPNHVGHTYALLANLRAYASLLDAVQKPYPLPGETTSQLVELRGTEDRIEAHFRALLDNAEARLRPADRDNLKRYEEANQKLPAPSSNPRVVFFGDSITDFWRLNEYFPGKDYVNRGISGQVTSEMLGRLRADVIDLRPQAVVILAGTNDLARGTPVSTVTNNYTMIAELLRLHNIKVVFASVLPVSDYHKAADPDWERSKLRQPASILALNSWLKKYCAANGHAYLDYFAAMVDTAGMLQAALADDGLHPNTAGYRAMAPLAQAAIDGLALTSGTPQPVRKKKRLPSK